MTSHCSRSEGQSSRSQGHVTYQHQQRCNSALETENVLKSEAEIWPFHACAVKNTQYNLVIETIWSLCNCYEADVTFHRMCF